MEMRFCLSCAIPLTPESVSVNDTFCNNCTDETGTLHPREHVRGGIAQWLGMIQPGLSEEKALERAEHYLKAMPAWAA
jgi:hypothetical protein